MQYAYLDLLLIIVKGCIGKISARIMTKLGTE